MTDMEEKDTIETIDSGSAEPHGNGRLLKRILLGLGAACAILVIFLLVLDSTGAKYRKEHSQEFHDTV